MRLRNISAAFLVGVAVMAGPAQAATYLITYKGVVTSGVDGAGVFGAVGADLTGKAFTSVYTLNDAVPGASYQYYSMQSTAESGPSQGPSPLLAKFTINGISKELTGRVAGSQSTRFAFLPSKDYTISNTVNDLYNNEDGSSVYDSLKNVINNIGNSMFPSVSFGNDFSHTLEDGDFSTGYNTSGSYYLYGVWTPDYVSNSWNYVETRIDLSNLSVSSVLAPVIPAVPEPVTWAMMVLGFGVVGGAMRRRKAVVRVSYG